MVNTPSSLHTEIRFLMRWFAHARINTPPAVLHMRCANSPVRNPDESASFTCDKSNTILLCPPELRSTRSEEHTSELQSREKLVCRLMHEKKNKWILILRI